MSIRISIAALLVCAPLALPGCDETDKKADAKAGDEKTDEKTDAKADAKADAKTDAKADAKAALVDKAEEFMTQACACKDIDCASAVAGKQSAWMADAADAMTDLDDEDARKITDAATGMAECMSKIAATGG
jgi:hypothetical protein